MHIHPGMLTPNTLNGAEATLAAKRAADTRKRLLAAASAPEDSGTPETAWMVGAWAGQQNSPGQSTQSGQSGHSAQTASAPETLVDSTSTPALKTSLTTSSEQASNRSSSLPAVSYWA